MLVNLTEFADWCHSGIFGNVLCCLGNNIICYHWKCKQIIDIDITRRFDVCCPVMRLAEKIITTG